MRLPAAACVQPRRSLPCLLLLLRRLLLLRAARLLLDAACLRLCRSPLHLPLLRHQGRWRRRMRCCV